MKESELFYIYSHPVQEPERDGVVPHVGAGPHPCHREGAEGHREQDDVDPSEHQEVEHPEPAAVHVVGVGVLVAVAAGHHLD